MANTAFFLRLLGLEVRGRFAGVDEGAKVAGEDGTLVSKSSLCFRFLPRIFTGVRYRSIAPGSRGYSCTACGVVVFGKAASWERESLWLTSAGATRG
jgi:hypothetical protein